MAEHQLKELDKRPCVLRKVTQLEEEASEHDIIATIRVAVSKPDIGHVEPGDLNKLC